MSKQTFDPITRSIRAAETDARLIIANAEATIASMRRKRKNSVTANQEIFDKLGECIQNTSQLHDNVVAHSHLVADNIATRSQRNVLAIRNGLLEVANRMVEQCTMATLPAGVYDPTTAFNSIATALLRNGLLESEVVINTVAYDPRAIGYIASYQLIQYAITIIVIVKSTSDGKNLGEGSDEITVSVWEDRMPPLWDSSYHNAAGFMLPVGFPKKSLGHWTKQTDNALVDYVATMLGRSVKIVTPNSPDAAGTSHRQDTNRFGTQMGRSGKQGSDKFDYQSQRAIITNALDSTTVGEQGELVLRLRPEVVNKTTLARYILTILQECIGEPLDAAISLHRDGMYEIKFPSNKSQGAKVLGTIQALLEGGDA